MIDAWSGPPLTPRTVDLTLSGGPHTLRYEYVEQTGGATARLTWDRLTPVVLASGAPLWPRESRTSIDGRYRMQYQDDGNLVVVRLADDTCAWALWTNNTSAGVVVMQDVCSRNGVGIGRRSIMYPSSAVKASSVARAAI